MGFSVRIHRTVPALPFQVRPAQKAASQGLEELDQRALIVRGKLRTVVMPVVLHEVRTVTELEQGLRQRAWIVPMANMGEEGVRESAGIQVGIEVDRGPG